MPGVDAPVLALTCGEPAGIGPELAVMLAADGVPAARVVAVGDPALLAERAALIGREVEIRQLAPDEAPPRRGAACCRCGR